MEKILAQALGEDVSQLAREEKQLLLSRLLARVAHEIRNPLSSLHIHVQLLEEDLAKAPPEMREKAANRLEIIHGELHRLENIVKQFLSLAGPSSLNLEVVEVKKLINDVCELLEPEASSRGIGMSREVSEKVPPFYADPVQLTQALVNLVINAIQAIGEGGRIELRGDLDASGKSVVMSVRDTGPGVPKEKQRTIFEPFFTTKAEGSGVGLWVVQQIVSAHGGAALVTAAPDGGAIFMMQLPLRREEGSHGQVEN